MRRSHHARCRRASGGSEESGASGGEGKGFRVIGGPFNLERLRSIAVDQRPHASVKSSTKCCCRYSTQPAGRFGQLDRFGHLIAQCGLSAGLRMINQRTEIAQSMFIQRGGRGRDEVLAFGDELLQAIDQFRWRKPGNIQSPQLKEKAIHRVRR